MDEFLAVSEQLEILFEQVRNPATNHAYTMKEVSEAIDVSLAALSQLRTGRIKNPQLHTLREICRFFNVPLRYFETRSVEECYAVLAGYQSEDIEPINEIAFRATHLSPKSQRDVLTIIRWVQAAEEQRKNGNHLPPLPNLETYDED